MNKWTEVFSAMLASLEFVLDKDNGGFCLIDLQGGNLGDIESDRFETAEEIIDRMDVYVNDCYLADLAEEYGEYFIVPEWAKIEAGSPSDWAAFAKKYDGYRKAGKFIEDHRHQFDVMEMIADHLAEVDLEEIVMPKKEAENEN